MISSKTRLPLIGHLVKVVHKVDFLDGRPLTVHIAYINGLSVNAVDVRGRT